MNLEYNIQESLWNLKNIIPKDMEMTVVNKITDLNEDCMCGVKQKAIYSIVLINDIIPDNMMGKPIDGRLKLTWDETDVLKVISVRTPGKLGDSIPDNKRESIIERMCALTTGELTKKLKNTPEDLQTDIVERVLVPCDDKDWSVRDASVRAIGGIGMIIPAGKREKIISKLMELTKDFDPIVRDSSLRSINRLKFAIPRNVKDEVDNLLKLHKSNLD